MAQVAEKPSAAIFWRPSSVVLPPLLAKTFMRPMFIKMGFIRFFILVTLLQFMAALPIKMLLRWIFNLKYIVALPEIFFNI